MITFANEGVPLPTLDFNRVKDWIIRVAESHGFSTGRLSYLFVGDAEILEANRKHLNHDFYTDIITFDYTHRNRIAGDMIISLDTVRSNAEQLEQSYEVELLRVIIHGVLHLCGINDKGPGEREIMEDNENAALRLWKDEV
ncbi:MAG: rRNA maturation RNase YbeY [Muribaculaceae bacterium]|nr:rRNA maturation RNase YbeY [Muribaculaceae bacterium]